MSRPAGTLAAHSVTKHHGSHVVLEDVSLGVPPRSRIGVVGREVWVPNDESNTVSRIDIATNDVIETIAAGANTAVVAPAAGDVWVSNFDAGTVWRIRPG